MYGTIKGQLEKELQEIKDAGLYKSERIITSSQDAVIKISTGDSGKLNHRLYVHTVL